MTKAQKKKQQQQQANKNKNKTGRPTGRALDKLLQSPSLKAKTLKGVYGPDLQTAVAESVVRYGPQREQLTSLLDQARGAYKGDVTATKAGAKSIVMHARRAAKPTKAIYNEATGAQQAAASDVSNAFSALGAAADPYRAATAREQGGAKTRIAGQRAEALQDLRDREMEARAGKVYGIKQARTNLSGDVAKIVQQARSLGEQEGAYQTGRVGSLKSERAERGIKLKVQRESEKAKARAREDEQKHDTELENQRQAGRTKLKQIDVAARKAAASSGPGGSKPASRAEKRSFDANFSKAVRYAKAYAKTDGKGNQRSRKEAGDDLITGRPASKESSGIPAIENQVALSAALDMAYLGYVTPKNVKRIRSLGIRVKDVPGAKAASTYRNQTYTPGSNK